MSEPEFPLRLRLRLMKLTFRYIFYVELYSGVVWFSVIFRVKVRVRVSYRVRV